MIFYNTKRKHQTSRNRLFSVSIQYDLNELSHRNAIRWTPGKENVKNVVEYASPVWAAIPLYLDELIESVQRKALKIIFGRVDYTEALVLAGLESLSDRRVGACKRFMATARQMSPLKNIIPSPAAIESHYSIRVQLPRRQHGHTRRINDFVTYKFQWMYVNG